MASVQPCPRKPLISGATQEEQRIVDPAFGLIRVQFSRDYVVVPGKHDRCLDDEPVGILYKAIEPAKLVIEFWTGPDCRSEDIDSRSKCHQ